MFRLRCNTVLKLTDYHISRHVVSTFKRLTTTTTHCDLINFSLNRRGLIQKYSARTPPVGLIVAACSKYSTPIILASDRKSLDFYRTISLANQRPTHTSVQAQVPRIMQLRFQATPVNLNAQVDRNNNKLHKFKIYRTYSGACLGLTLGQCELENNCSASICLRSCTSGPIHPSSRCVHHSPSSGSAPSSRHPRGSSVVPK